MNKRMQYNILHNSVQPCLTLEMHGYTFKREGRYSYCYKLLQEMSVVKHK